MKPSSNDLGNAAPHYLASLTPSGAMKQPLGVLILHGFTSSLDTVRALQPMVEQLGLPYRMPVLRGHNSQYKNLYGVTWQDWYADADAALKEVLAEVDKAVVIGLSMGGVVALDLAMHYPARLAGIVTLAAALEFASPLTRFTPLLTKVLREFNSPNAFSDRELAKRNTNYRKFPTATFKSLWEYGKQIEGKLPQVRTPLLVLATRKDTVVSPNAATQIYERVSTADEQKRIVWFERSGHEMLQDLEAAAVVQTIEDWLVDEMGAVRRLLIAEW